MDKPVVLVHSVSMDPIDTRDIQATLMGDDDAYARIVGRHQRMISGRMYRFTRDRTSLEELVNDVFVEAFVSLKGYKGTGPFDHWLSCIATRVGYRFWRNQKKRASREIALQDWDMVSKGADQISAIDAAELVHFMLARLPDRDRLVLTLMYIEELSVSEIAEHSGWSRTMVKVQAHRARKKFKTLLEETEIDRP